MTRKEGGCPLRIIQPVHILGIVAIVVLYYLLPTMSNDASATVAFAAAAIGTGVAGYIGYRVVSSRGLDAAGAARANPPLRVVITGSSRGLGLMMAREFLERGDSVCVNSRCDGCAKACAAGLRCEFANAAPAGQQQVLGIGADVTNADEVDALAANAAAGFAGHGIDVWINNAGITQHDKAPLHEVPAATLKAIVSTNLLGTLYGCRAAIKTMLGQSAPRAGGHVFNMDGAGSSGMSTPTFAAYGATKAGFPQLLKSLTKETKGTSVGVHTLSPGMVTTDLLLNGSRTKKVLGIFNILAELPETAAAWLVPRVRATALQGGSAASGRYYKFLTRGSVAWRFATAFQRKNRLVDTESGKVVAARKWGDAPLGFRCEKCAAKKGGEE